MELIRGAHNLEQRHRPCVATIGTFDGIHRGHQAVIEALHAAGRRLQRPATVILFEPQPREFFTPDRAPGRITRLRDKLRILESLGVERTLCLRFDHRLAREPAEDFMRRLLIDALDVRFLMVGDDFRFGHRRRGDFSMLRSAAQAFGFELERMPTVHDGDSRVSSTRVREALEAGDLATAERLLGHRLRITGRVAHGEALGRELGWPTANIRFGPHPPPMRGIFNVRVHGLGEPRPGVASLGTRPTVNGVETLLETYLLDFSGDLYGRPIEVEFLTRQRGEERFDGLDALKEQIAADVAAARTWFVDHGYLTANSAG
ncbi:bifunctional riboflavin kinase/FAD synthetase [Spiribacter aquaticus]|uniref:Riboflavin biosynthesis protein n=1 Tax=Spiribacter aquaticus TaxID=1935996 RepID=A0A557RH39_9GAMM|nr:MULTISPECIES: bifunctional riboflavin kinase/FAD synthetase [Spiribacter]AUB78822.1 riboflavin biosynthesis protein RibF [Spiribacter roseus]KAF0280767.1 riboflavin biosynthesis protein RibF [Spiribacter roseus]TVO64482.1 bifunctional riboflavin kinase/FAD synthetase [Spiribacter aquaticus]